MNPLLRLPYGAAVQFARAGAVVAPAGGGKTSRALHARRRIRRRYAAWAAAHRDASRALLWMHASSVGEGLQARPLLEAVRTARADRQLAYTFFSPSAEPFARTLDVDFADYLPFDAAGDARAVLDALRPQALVFSKLDVWPVLVREASRRGIRLGLTSATLAADSARRGGLARALLGDAYRRLDAVGAVDDEDASRLVAMGVRGAAIQVTGDTRYDQVWARTAGILASVPDIVAALRAPRPTLVAGSTWPADERLLAPAWDAFRRRLPEARLIIAPHEPTAAHLGALERWAMPARYSIRRVDAPDAAAADVVLVDRVGILGDLYALADVAYVGGGLGAGLHSVIEPAAFGAPVIFGSRTAGHPPSRDATALLAAGGAAPIASSDELADRLGSWMVDASAARPAGDAARAVVQSGLGATARSLALVETLLG